jgi:hypothetical protein
MIDTIARKLRDRRRVLARKPLADLLLWAGYHALVPHRGIEMDARSVAMLEDEVLMAMHRLADTGVLAYFGIREAAEFGDPPVRVHVIASPPPWGHTEVDVWPLVDWVMDGGARARGWMSPGSMTQDLLR